MKFLLTSLLLVSSDGPTPLDIQKLFEEMQSAQTENHPAEEVSIEMTSQIDDESTARFVHQLDSAHGAKRINVLINTPGGDLDSVILMSQALERAAKSAEVRCTVDGEAASAGFYLLQSCQHRAITTRSRLMAHEPYAFTSGPARLTQDTMRNYADAIKAATRVYAEQCVARMHMTVEQFLARIKGRDWWLNSDEALRLGAVDEVLPTPAKQLKG